MRTVLALALGGWLALGCASPSIHKRTWLEARTANFTLWSCQREANVRELARDLERFRSVVEFVVGEPVPTSPVPVRVYAFDSVYTYRPFAIPGAAGYFESTLRDSKIVLTGPSARSIDTTELIQHEYVHFLLDNHADLVYPRWYHEGFAEFLGSIRFQGKRVVVGGVPSGRLLGFPNWIPTEQLLDLEVGTKVDANALYTQSWALVHYLHFGRETEGRESTRKQLTRYFRAREKGSPVPEAVEGAFGMSVDDLDAQLGRYVRNGRFPSYAADAAQFDMDEEPQLRTLSPEEVAVALGNLSLPRKRYRQALDYFEEAQRLKPDSVDARLGRAAALAGQAQLEEAEAQYRQALADAPDDAIAHLDLANFLAARAAVTEDASARAQLVAEARRHYVRSWKLDDAIPETYARYGATYLLEGEDPAKGLQTLRHAYKLLPSSMTIRIELARLYLALGDEAQARRFALSAAAVAHEEENEQIIEDILARTASAAP